MNIPRYLKASPELAAVAEHAQRLLALQDLFESIAPPTLAPHCRVANFIQGVLVVNAANTLIAAKLRQVVPSLIDEFCYRGWKVTAIQVGVQDRAAAPQQESPEACRLDPAARAELAAFARAATDPRLRLAVEHLLEHAEAGGSDTSRGDKAAGDPV